MIGLDTNVVIRLLVGDDAAQFAAAQAAVSAAEAAQEPLWIGLPVAQEIVWVLARSYGYPREDIARALRALLERENVLFEDESAIEAALHTFETGTCDFADALLGQRNRAAGCRHTLTFDRNAARLPDFRMIAAQS